MITKVEYQKKNKNRVNVFIDNTFICGLNAETAIKNGIREGVKICEEDIKKLQEESDRKELSLKMADYANRYFKSESEIKHHFVQKGYEVKLVEEGLQKLKDYGFVNDLVFAESFVNSKIKMDGVYKIRQALIKKGINRTVIDNTLQGIDGSNTCLSVCQKWFKNKEKTRENKAKAFRFLQNRGFNSEEIISALNACIKGDDDDRDWD